MDIEELRKTQVVTKDGHFMPLVFVDMSVPTAAIGAMCTYAGRSIDQKVKENKNKMSVHFSKAKGFAFTPISNKPQELSQLALSIDDVIY